MGLSLFLLPLFLPLKDADITLFFRPSEGTIPEQAQGLFDHGASAACHPSHCFHVDGHYTVNAYRAYVEWFDAKAERRALQGGLKFSVERKNWGACGMSKVG